MAYNVPNLVDDLDEHEEYFEYSGIDPTKLEPGDCILYKPSGLFGLAIAVKSWHAISHVEVYVGNGQSVASRDGIGVNLYPLRTSGIDLVLRPAGEFKLLDALAWFQTVKGQKYDWWGLLRFSWRSEYVPSKLTKNKMFCSEFATRFYRHGGLNPFPNEDADAIAPFQFAFNPLFHLTSPQELC